jgi:hypothetical protein
MESVKAHLVAFHRQREHAIGPTATRVVGMFVIHTHLPFAHEGETLRKEQRCASAQ